MFVREVRVRTPGLEVEVQGKKYKQYQETSYNNYPNVEDHLQCELRQFSNWVFSLVQNDLRIKREPSPVGKPVTGTGDLEAILAAIKDEGVSIEEVNGRYRLQKTKESVHLRAIPRVPGAPREQIEDTQGCILTPPSRSDVEEIVVDSGTQAKSKPDSAQPAGLGQREGKMQVEFFNQGDSKQEITLIMRSPEGMLYYLGELMRLEMHGYIPEVCIQGRFQPVFFASKGKVTGCDSAIIATYDGVEYYIPKSSATEKAQEPPCARGDFRIRRDAEAGCTRNRAMQSLSLVSQLIALQKSAKDLPTTDVVRVIGQ